MKKCAHPGMTSVGEIMQMAAGLHIGLGLCDAPKTCALCKAARKYQRMGITDPAEIVRRIVAENDKKKPRKRKR